MRAALPAITAITYLFLAAVPCPPSAELRAAAPHEHAAAGGDSTSITAPCPCSCEHGAATAGVARHGEPAALIAAASPPLAPAHPFARERVQRLPDAPISVDSPVPIAA